MVPSRPGDIIGLPGALGRASSGINVATNTQWLAYTPAVGEIVYASDTNLYYVGDGSTAGGVAQTIPFSAHQLRSLGIIVPRGRNYSYSIREAMQSANTASIPGGYVVGNSIAGGAGASGQTTTSWWSICGSKLATFAGIGTQANWSPSNVGIAGATVFNILGYLSDNCDGSPTVPTRSRLWNTTPVYITIGPTYRNDGGIPIAQWSMALRCAAQACKRHNVDCVMVTDPPNINMTTGAILDLSMEPYRLAMRQIASDEGATLVDWWLWDWLQTQFGVSLISKRAVDGVHPNDVGHSEGGNLLYAALTAGGVAPAPAFGRPSDVFLGQNFIVSAFVGVNSPPSLSTLPLLSNSARNIQRNTENNKGYVLGSGSSMIFPSPGGARMAAIACCQDPANTGTLTALMLGNSIATGLSWATGTGYESTQYVSITANTNSPGQFKLTAVGGQVSVLGVTFIGAWLNEFHTASPDPVAVATGTWGADTIAADNTIYGATTPTAVSSSTVGDTWVRAWYGDTCSIHLEKSNAVGKITYSTDGGGSSTFDCYTTAGTFGVDLRLASGVTVGWHTTTVTVATKNASSSSNLIKLCGFRSAVSLPDPIVWDFPLVVGETLQLPDFWAEAYVVRALTGTPYINQWVPGQSSVSLTGSAGDKAWVRLRR